ncbi:uncharacterized protein BJ212DRAFT_1296002 [Suillus subaureus]|uniref:Uncharacterized protein n=1 Tax=Suillus subaureus TaxID=48587 RepID=A0A9P7EJF8_9AGAM|nr:uncharacterized protein BJ212DRAFT_1296002 [Suillus subaureus]KAG1823356.1 hypothetical protein BJ212DRAFT_1296002 [Suillus subaureus]
MHLKAQLLSPRIAPVILYNELLEIAGLSSDGHADILTNLQASQSNHDFITTTLRQAVSQLPSTIASRLECAPLTILSQPTLILVSVEEPTKKPEAVETKEKLRAKRKKRRGAGGGATQGATIGADSGPVSAGASHGGKTGGKGKGGKKK